MAAELSQLPGEHNRKFIVREAVILSFSETQKEHEMNTGQAGAGAKLGYWRPLRRDLQGGNIPIPDERLLPLLQKITDEERPSYVPCCVVGNPVPDPMRPGELTLSNGIMFRRFAWYAKQGVYCSCDQADPIGRKAIRSVQELAKENGREFKREVGKKELPCLGESCKDYMGGRCKLQVVVSVRLPWAGAKVAMYRTTGQASFEAMMASLLDIHQMAGTLHGIPLELVYGETKSRKFGMIPCVRFEPDRHIADRLLEEGRRVSQLYGDTTRVAQLAERARTEIVAFVEDPSEQAQFRQEFHPNNRDLPPVDATFSVETPPAHAPQGLEETAPEPEDEGEPFELQSPPEGPVHDFPPVADVVDLATFKACMLSVGVRTPAQMAKAKAAARCEEYKLDQLDIEALRAIYGLAREAAA